ncbi:MAG: CDP-diacylglycerol--serine O-phosphatidyltransferase [Bacteroidota bacterium]
MKNHIPNTITLFNMLSGILSIYSAMSGYLDLAAYLIFIAAGFDFLDGFAARLLNAKSEIGAQLDSLADVVSFGVAPGFILFQMISISHGQPTTLGGDFNIIPFIAFIVPAFGALRLAKFNVDDEQTTSFKGLPIPALGILIASFPLIKTYLYEDRELFYMIITNTYFLLMVAVVGSLLMVSNLPMFALKFEGFGWKKNMTKYLFLIISVLLIIFLQIVAVPFIILFYLFFSLVIHLVDIQ